MLWLLNFFPDWVFHGVLATGCAAMIIGVIMHKIPGMFQYGFVLKLGGLLLIVAGLMFEGALTLKKDYDLKEAKLTEQLLIAQARGETIVIKVVEELVYRDRIITKRGADVITYIDRVAHTIDSSCTLTASSVNVHNDAASEPVATEVAK